MTTRKFLNLVIAISCIANSGYAQDSSSVNISFSKTLVAHTKDLEACALSKDGKWLATAGWDRDIKLISMDSANLGKVSKTFTGNQSGVNKVTFSPDNTLLASAGKDFIARVWNIETQELVLSSFENNNEITQIIFSPDSKFLMTSSMDGSIRMYDILNQQNNIPPKFIPVSGSITDFAPTKSGKGFAIASANNNTIQFINFKGTVMSSIEGHAGQINCLKYSPNNKYLASGSADNTAIIWDAKTNQKLFTLTGHQWQVNALQWSYDERFLLTCSKSGESILWDVKTGTKLADFKNQISDAHSIDISADLKQIVVAGKSDITFKGAELFNTSLEKIKKQTAKPAAGNKDKKPNAAPKTKTK